MSDELKSALLIGDIRHRRFTPVRHALKYTLFMPCIDLDELEQLQSNLWCFGTRWWHWARFKRADYLGEGDLKQAVLDKVCDLTGERITGTVKAVIHLRYLGIYFSPVNFYYVYDLDGTWKYLLAEVSNTPWNERHYYAIPASDNTQNKSAWSHPKAFHVSPFNPIEQQYVWKLKPLAKRLFIHLECHREQKEFDATLMMNKHPLTSQALLTQLIYVPVMAIKVTTGIYWHALKLWLKGAPFYSHPKYQQETQDKQKSKDVKEQR
ncbi:DUF1365 domain-containing protein [Vibrio nereis]|uniref:Chromosome partitioning protein ParA n=1 Tax=Vibrio nereis TaxID=693 RepID=A0A0M0HTJ3_VIBNE|nr:DUF1365 family protein [Vibrio nereis]KOO05391.1 chromosome partitioning protein ParA [Vibrio nereis]